MFKKVYTIKPYLDYDKEQDCALFFFDEESKGLKREPFELGTSAMIALTCKAFAIDPQKPFELIFSNQSFGNEEVVFNRGLKANGGYWYYSPMLRLCGWLCPVLFKYFYFAPKNIYVKVKQL